VIDDFENHNIMKFRQFQKLNCNITTVLGTKSIIHSYTSDWLVIKLFQIKYIEHKHKISM